MVRTSERWCRYCGWGISFVVAISCSLVLRGEENSAAPLPAEEAAKSMIVPEGFRVSLFAGEPDVQQPIGFCIDDRGRLWIAEAYNYPNHGTRPGDRIVIFEDGDGDGRFDKRKVFYDQLNYVTGIEVGFGGAWVMSPPYFYFIPDQNRDDIPDAEPRILLDGFGNHANAHNLANGFAWGPDGWLYGTHGRTNWSRIGKPGIPDDQREQYDGGVYRYHPVRHVWEPYADGTTNPWGIDWNDVGEAFVCNCVNPHLFHVIPGAHYEPWRNRESSQYAYQRIDTIADHLHFIGKNNVRDGIGSTEEDAAGGGHAHCGTMVYLGDNWPDRYRNSVFMNNIHGKRINHDWLRRAGSGYVASHGADVMRSRDPWHVGVTLQYGPDGGVYVLDWSDTGECHHTKNTQRETGRVFKITYGEPTRAIDDVSVLSNDELVQLQLHRNDWYVRHARRLLQERAASGQDMHSVREKLRAIFQDHADVARRLRAFWALWSIDGMDEAFLLTQLSDPQESIRSWSVRWLAERFDSSPVVLQRLEALAASEASPHVRLYLASALQRLSRGDRWAIAWRLIDRAEDAADHNIPLMLWYAIEPLVDDDLVKFVKLAIKSRIPLIRRHAARRVASHSSRSVGIDELLGSLRFQKDSAVQADILQGMLQGLAGVRQMKAPSEWSRISEVFFSSPEERVRQAAIELALVFDDPVGLDRLRRQVLDVELASELRLRGLQALVEKRATGTDELLLAVLQDPILQRSSIQGLAAFEHPDTAPTLLRAYSSLDATAQQDVLQTLASRPAWGQALMDEIESRRLARHAISAFTARQLQSLGDPELTARVRQIWGELRSAPTEVTKQLASLKKELTPAAMRNANQQQGRSLFQKHCGSCHRLFGEGGTIGPDLTGAQRTNFDYLLENILDPSAAVAKDYQMEVILLDSGRTVTGLVVDESGEALVIQTVNERLILPKGEIEQRKQSMVSLMPDGILNALSKAQLIDLIAYLGSSVPSSAAP